MIYEYSLSLVGLYIEMKAKKRRIYIINLWKVPKWAENSLRSFSFLAALAEWGYIA